MLIGCGTINENDPGMLTVRQTAASLMPIAFWLRRNQTSSPSSRSWHILGPAQTLSPQPKTCSLGRLCKPSVSCPQNYCPLTYCTVYAVPPDAYLSPGSPLAPKIFLPSAFSSISKEFPTVSVLTAVVLRASRRFTREDVVDYPAN
jgi:hypothetical protein